MSRSASRARVDVVTILAMLIAAFLWFSVAFDTATGMVTRVAEGDVALTRTGALGTDAALRQIPAAGGCAVSGDLVGNGDPAEVYAVLCGQPER
jgi:hypothetical protein